jgi:molecular chaperone Hsp33
MNDSNNQITGFDRLLGFTLPDRDARGRTVRLGPVLDQILAAHDYPPAIKHLLAEALVLTALMGGLLKSEGSQLTMQAQAQGAVVELLVCDYLDGALRGYVKHDPQRVAMLGANPSLPALFGEGALTITFDVAETKQRYQGMVPLEGSSMTAAVEQYFARSEQIPTLLRSAVQTRREGSVAGGLLIQHLSEGEEGRQRLHVGEAHAHWGHVTALAGSIQHEELADRALPLEDIVWRLFHEEREVRTQPGARLSRGCRCSIEHFEQVLSRFPKEDRREMRDENGIILVDCAFCSREFPIQD